MRATATRPQKPSGEAALQRIWAEGPLPQPLRCLDGEPLRVIFRGRANGGPGPDFRNAIFLNGKQRPVRGDVELHCRLADWWAHGHASDPAYRAVTLHVVAAGGGTNRGARPAGGRIAELRAIEPGARPPAAVERCCALALTRQPRALRAALTRLGRRRLRAKALGLQRAFQGASPTPDSDRDQVAYEALLHALGQGGHGNSGTARIGSLRPPGRAACGTTGRCVTTGSDPASRLRNGAARALGRGAAVPDPGATGQFHGAPPAGRRAPDRGGSRDRRALRSTRFGQRPPRRHGS